MNPLRKQHNSQVKKKKKKERKLLNKSKQKYWEFNIKKSPNLNAICQKYFTFFRKHGF